MSPKRVTMFVLNDVRQDARVQREAATLAAAGWTVTVVGRAGDPSIVERESRDGYAIVRVPVPGAMRRRLIEAGAGRAQGGGAPGVRRGRGPASLAVAAVGRLAAAPAVGSLVRGLDVLVRWRAGVEAWGRVAADAAPVSDVWHAHDLTGVPAALIARARHGGRFVFDAHELFLEAGDTATRPAWARRVLGRLERRAIAEADAVVTVNDAVAAELRASATPRRLVVVHNAPAGVADRGDRSASPPLRAAAGVPDGAPIALYHGSLAPGRGVETLLAAIERPGLEAVHAVVLGSGQGAAAVEAARRGPAGERIHLLPPVPPEDVVAWVAGADVGVMPIAPTTRNHRLSTPNKLFECLAAGVPVVASDFPPVRAIVAADPAAPLGVLVDPTDVGAVAEAIRSIVDAAPAERTALRDRCLAAARERWSWDREAAGLVGLYQALAGETEPDPTEPPTEGHTGQRVTFVLPTSGAFDARTRRMASGLAGRGHDVLVFARAEPGLPAEECLADGARLVRVDAGRPVSPASSGAGVLARLVRLGTEPVRIARTALRSRRQARAAADRDRPAHLYHAMGFLALPVAAALAARARAPYVYDARDLYSEGNNVARLPGLARRLFVRRERAWAAGAAAVVTVNEALAAELAVRLRIDRPAVVMNAQPRRDPGAPRPPDRLRPALGLPAGTPIVLYHGGFMRDRGLPESIAAMRSPGLERVHLVLMGDGPLAVELRRLAGEPGAAGRVHLLPPVPPAELLDWVAGADVGLMPNQPRTVNERISTPNKLFECLTAGVPVVSSDFPERRRIVIDDPDGPLGAVCDPTDPAAIGAAIAGLLALPAPEFEALRVRCAHAAAERWAWEVQFEQLLEVYGRVTGRPW